MKWVQVWVLTVLGLFSAISIESYGQEVEAWRPTQASLRAEERGADCGTFRKLELKSTADLKTSKERLHSLETIMQSRWKELRQCAAARGYAKVSDRAYSVLAEICPTAYHDWITPGYRAQMYLQDIRDSANQVEKYSGLVENHCRNLPPAENVRPVSAEIF